MEADARHIIGLSMNKIMSSRSRKGGVSLHRNLMIASVLVKARTFYLASVAVVEQRRDSVSEGVTVPPANNAGEGTQDSESGIPCKVEDMDIAVQPEETRSVAVAVLAKGDPDQGNTASSSIDNSISLSDEAMLVGNLSPELDNLLLLCDSASVIDEHSNDISPMPMDMSETSDVLEDVDAEQHKENVAPSPETSVLSPRRKRAYTEVECAVMSIGGTPELACSVTNDNCNVISRDANADSEHGFSSHSNRSNSSNANNGSIHTCLKRIKLDLVDIRNSKRSTMKNQTTQHLDINLHAVSGVRSVGSCGGSGGSVYDSFTSQGSSLRSPPMLLGTV